MTYVVNQRTGEVHENTCPRVNSVASKGPWDPAKAQLTPGVRACRFCMPAGLPLRHVAPATDAEAELLHDFGAWIAEKPEIDVGSVGEAVDMFLAERAKR